jgi:hypothetical protein
MLVIISQVIVLGLISKLEVELTVGFVGEREGKTKKRL